MPPVRLPAEAELARDALAAPLLARAASLARWTRPGTPVGAGGELLTAGLKGAVTHLGLDEDQDGEALAADAWHFAVDTGLVEITETGAETDGGEDPAVAGTAAPGEELAQLTGGGPGDVLELWAAGVDAVLDDAATPTFEEMLGDLGGLDGAVSPDGEIDPDAIDLDALAWDQEEAAGFLDAALGSLYLFAVTDEAGQAASMVPLPMVAAASLVPEDMDELSAEALDELSEAVLKLDGQFRALAGTGLLDYQPVDDSVLVDGEPDERAADGEDFAGGSGAPGGSGALDAPGQDGDEEDLSRYGLARLTPLGLWAVRRRMREAGLEAPVIGELAGRDAAALLAALPFRPEPAANEEAGLWLAGREPLDAARELLAAARGVDEEGPGRRFGCQLVLSLLDPRAEPAVREVLDDRELGGLARVWLAERGVAGIPEPDEDMIFWLTVDTLAAQLLPFGVEEDAAELQELVSGLARQHSEFFDRAWRSDHPATADVLEAVGRVHPDKQLAKRARKAAFKARSRRGE
ncbi:hypothetical protein [Streptomyces sp. NBC_01803]|uniref:hypothetical protein n=1 Tax=Streptomyces sp. NBC_01803 TaxID=2975946 RepID=UPI002DDB932E|nr:hypothetical protein [Streptomyces sp. NBC_01803]WSA46795.1 hypothetical protein OIE51_22985 [Streptomyces sp. NBC_01803]